MDNHSTPTHLFSSFISRTFAILILCLLGCSSPVLAKSNSKIEKEWVKIQENIDNLSIEELRYQCRKLVSKSDQVDSTVIDIHRLLAEIALEYNDLGGLYEEYLFFANPQEGSEDSIDSELAMTLEETYWNLVDGESSLSFPDGVYFSDVCNTKDSLPYLAFEIKSHQDDTKSIQLLPCCAYAHQNDVFGKDRKIKNTLGNSTSIHIDSIGYFASFEMGELKLGSPIVAQSLLNNSANIAGIFTQYANMSGVSFGASLGLNFLSAAVSVAGLAAANQVSASTKVGELIAMHFNPNANGIIDVDFRNYIASMSTNKSQPEITDIKCKMRLYKLYPHHGILFKDNKSNFLTYDNEIDKDILWKFHPVNYETEYYTKKNKKWGRSTGIVIGLVFGPLGATAGYFIGKSVDKKVNKPEYNNSSYLKFYQHLLLEPVLNSELKDYVPTKDLSFKYDIKDTNATIRIGDWDKKKKHVKSCCIELKDDNSIEMCLWKKGKSVYPKLIIAPDGTYRYFDGLDEQENVKCHFIGPNNQWIFNGVLNKGQEAGSGIITFETGEEKDVHWTGAQFIDR